MWHLSQNDFQYGQDSDKPGVDPQFLTIKVPSMLLPNTATTYTKQMKNSATLYAKLEQVFPASGVDLTTLPIHCAYPLHLHLQETHSPLNEVSFRKREPSCQPQAELKGSSEHSQ